MDTPSGPRDQQRFFQPHFLLQSKKQAFAKNAQPRETATPKTVFVFCMGGDLPTKEAGRAGLARAVAEETGRMLGSDAVGILGDRALSAE
jgi:hypothetical protein